MNSSQILKIRLFNTGLINSPFKNTTEAVSHLGAVQAQDYTAAKWALGLRIKNSTDSDIEREFNDGLILRTHVLRPTWHFVLPEDIGWMLNLTAPRIKSRMAPYNQKLELDNALLNKSNKIITKSLQQYKYLTRKELKTILQKIGIETDVQRLAHIIMWAELEGLICSGPRKEKQFTYSLLEKRTPKVKKLTREESLAKLAHKYFRSHSPAQLKDFSWWSGLTAKDAREALEIIKSELRQTSISGKTYWLPANAKVKTSKSPSALLLSIYDEYTIAYKDRSDLCDTKDITKMISMGNALTSVIILDGKVAGTWKKSLKKNKVEITLNPFHKLNKNEKKALESEVYRFGKFSGINVVIKNFQ